MIHIGVIGCGQWGPNHIRNFSQINDCRVVGCADLNEARLKAMKNAFPGLHTTRHYKEILENTQIDAVVVSTPTSTHYRIAREALLAGKDVLCEKPLCLNVRDGHDLMSIAQRRKKILMVGHVFLFNAGIRMLREEISNGRLGRIYYMHSERTNLGPFRTDVNSVWDLATHDVYIFNYLLHALPREVSARGGRYLQKKIEDVSFISLVYPMDILVNIHVSWLDPRKVRQITVVGDKKMITWDDLDTVGPIKMYDRQVVPQFYYESFGEFHLLAKEGDITIPKIALYEPLKAQDTHFLECVRERKAPLAGGDAGLKVAKVLNAVEKSLARRGVPFPVK